jgi:hypothetical protein
MMEASGRGTERDVQFRWPEDVTPNQPALICRSGQVDAPLSLQTTVIVSSRQISCPLGDESAILNMKNSVYYGMNPVGTSIWNLLKEPKTIAEIRDTIVGEYDVDEERCERDLFTLLEQMRSEGLIEVHGEAGAVTAG